MIFDQLGAPELTMREKTIVLAVIGGCVFGVPLGTFAIGLLIGLMF